MLTWFLQAHFHLQLAVMFLFSLCKRIVLLPTDAGGEVQSSKHATNQMNEAKIGIMSSSFHSNITAKTLYDK